MLLVSFSTLIITYANFQNRPLNCQLNLDHDYYQNYSAGATFAFINKTISILKNLNFSDFAYKCSY